MKRRNSEINRLNEIYRDIVPIKITLSKCLKYLCQKEPYRMLKDWSYEMNSDPLQYDEPCDETATPTDGNSENDLIQLEEITEKVVQNISGINNQPKKSRSEMSNEDDEVKHCYNHLRPPIGSVQL